MDLFPGLASALPNPHHSSGAPKAIDHIPDLAKPLPLRNPFDHHLPPLTGLIPWTLYGTAWKQHRTADLVHAALRNGFRGIDTAAQPQHYDESAAGDGVRRAIGEGIVKREDLFTKFTPPKSQSMACPYDPLASWEEMVHQSIQSSLASFTIPTNGTDAYLDCLALHSPVEEWGDMVKIWNAMETYVPYHIRHLGICNASYGVVRGLYNHPEVTVKPSIVQNRWIAEEAFQEDLRGFCADRGIVFQAFWAMAKRNNSLKSSRAVVGVSQSAGVALAPAYLALLAGLGGLVVLNGTTDEEHMREDIEGVKIVGRWAEGEGEEAFRIALEIFEANMHEDYTASLHQ